MRNLLVIIALVQILQGTICFGEPVQYTDCLSPTIMLRSENLQKGFSSLFQRQARKRDFLQAPTHILKDFVGKADYVPSHIPFFMINPQIDDFLFELISRKYSLIKAGHMQSIEEVGNLLALQIASNIRVNNDDWLLVTPGSMQTPMSSSVYLAKYVSEKLDIDLVSVSQKKFSVKKYTSLTKEERKLAMDSTEFHFKNSGQINKKRIIIIEDGLTSGSKVKRLSEALYKQGATGVICYLYANFNGTESDLEFKFDTKFLEKEGVFGIIRLLNDAKNVLTVNMTQLVLGLLSNEEALFVAENINDERLQQLIDAAINLSNGNGHDRAERFQKVLRKRQPVQINAIGDSRLQVNNELMFIERSI